MSTRATAADAFNINTAQLDSSPVPAHHRRAMLNRSKCVFLVSATMVGLVAANGRAQGPPALMRTPPKPLVANAKPVRSCESLATVTLPNTTIESAMVDATNPAICRVVAITTHPPAGDKVRIWFAIPTSNWNGRFLGTGGGGFAGGQQAAVNQPVALGFAAGATDTGHEGGSAAFALDATGRLHLPAIRNFAPVGIHESHVTGQAW